MTRYEAYIGKDWEKLGIANVLVARSRSEKGVDFAVFLVDLLCLGVKDVLHHEGLGEEEFRAFREGPMGATISEPFHPACAKKLIEGAVAYATDLGFLPRRDYRKARRVLSGIDADTCPETFVYGENGVPCYVRGAEDSDDRVDRVLAVLEQKCGPDGFKYVDPGEDEDEDGEQGVEYEEQAAREDLMDWLEDEPDDVPGFYEVSGLITAMQLCPQSLSPSLLLNVLWKPAPTFVDANEAQAFLDILRHYWNNVAGLIAATVAVNADPEQTCIDVWEEDFDEDEGAVMIVAMRQWAGGFMRATELWPESWGNALIRSDLSPHWEVINCFAKIEEPGNLQRMDRMAAENPPRTFDRAVTTIARALREPFTLPGD